MLETEEDAQNISIIVDACQSAVYRLWQFDSHHAANEAEGREIMGAVKKFFNVEIEDPWKSRREGRQ